MGARRGQDSTGVTDRVVNQLLTFLDGVEDTLGSEGGGQIYVMVATSRPDMVDPALLRPGRIETHVHVGYPSKEDQREIYDTLLSELNCRDDVDSAVAHVCSHHKSKHFTGADVKGVVNSAFLTAAQDCIEGSLSLTYDVDRDVNSSDKVIAGRKLSSMQDVVITSNHILTAFQSAKPSISQSDLSYYNTLYSQFKLGEVDKSTTGRKTALA